MALETTTHDRISATRLLPEMVPSQLVELHKHRLAFSNISSLNELQFSLFGAGSKYEDAAESYSKAGNCYKVEQKWQEAGDAYMQAAELLQNKVQSAHEASAAFMDAGNCYKKVSVPDGVNAFRAGEQQ